MARWLKPTLFRFFSVAAPLLSVALGAELFLRSGTTRVIPSGASAGQTASIVSDPELVIRTTAKGRRLIPNTHIKIINDGLSHRDIDMDINSLGFRGPEVVRPKPPGTFRILALGDSITWGDYLQEGETFPSQTQNILNARGERTRFEVINAGIGDVGTREEVDLLEETGLQVQPDLVALCFYLNDSRPPWGFARELGHRAWLRRHSALCEWLYMRILLQRWVSRQGDDRFRWIQFVQQVPWKTDRKALLFLARAAKYDWGAAWESESWVEIDREFARLESLSRRHGFKVLVVVLPVSYQVHARYVEAFPQWAVHQLAQSYRFDFMDLLPLLRAHNRESIYYDQCHMVPRANAWVGQALADYIFKESELGEKAPS